MKTIPLVNSDRVALVDDEDYESLSRFQWRLMEGSDGVFYARRSDGHSAVLMHREIMKPQASELVDHRDLDGLNNQRSNLRLCTRQQNAQNARKYGDWRYSRYKGVTWSSNRWQAAIQARGKRIHLGCFLTQREAAIAYNAAAVEHFGEFARLNEIPPEPTPDDPPVPLPAFTSRYRGVYQKKQTGRWVAHIYRQKHQVHLGIFDTEEAAARAYDEAARRLHGLKARLNFPDD
jgi:hypothetical protein